MTSVAVLIACHNRRAKTIGCIEGLLRSQAFDRFRIGLYLVDDGSTDGTSEAVYRSFPAAHVIRGDGSLYWNGAMRLAFEAAMQDGGFDYYLWLNDDTIIYEDTFSKLILTAESARSGGRDAVIVGTTQAVLGGSATYGGVVRTSWWRPLKFRLLGISDESRQCDTMHGNCVLIPFRIAEEVGNLDSKFVHTMGDIDYGLRVRQAGFDIKTMPGCAGVCDHNAREMTYLDTSLSRRERWRRLRSVKGLPPKQWYVLTKRHCGLLWPAFWLWPYVHFWFRK